MSAATHPHVEVHPLSIRRPSGMSARTLRSHLLTGRTCIHRHQAATLPGLNAIHLDNQKRALVRRGIGVMRHASFVGWKIDLALLRTGFPGRDNSHMNRSAGHDLGEHDAVRSEPT